MRLSPSILAAALLAACSSAPASNSMTITRDGSTFSGMAGADWTNADLQSNAFAALCPKEKKVTDLEISRNAEGIAKVSGSCV